MRLMNLGSNEIYFKIDFCSLFWASMVIVRTSPQGGTHGPNQGRGAQPHPPGGGSREAPARGGAQRPPRNGQKASRKRAESEQNGTAQSIFRYGIVIFWARPCGSAELVARTRGTTRQNGASAQKKNIFFIGHPSELRLLVSAFNCLNLATFLAE